MLHLSMFEYIRNTFRRYHVNICTIDASFNLERSLIIRMLVTTNISFKLTCVICVLLFFELLTVWGIQIKGQIRPITQRATVHGLATYTNEYSRYTRLVAANFLEFPFARSKQNQPDCSTSSLLLFRFLVIND